MTVATTGHFNWSAKPEDPAYDRCSPNLLLIRAEMQARWHLANLGCYGERSIRGGEALSAHSHGAADDNRYQDVPGNPKYQGLAGRDVAVAEIMPWLVANSLELHISAIHDYVGARIWHPENGWHPASKNSAGRYNDPNMGGAMNGWLHVEPTLAGWSDSTPIALRLSDLHPPTTPPSAGGKFVHQTVKKGDTNADVYALQVILRKGAGQREVLVTGTFDAATEQALRNVQSVNHLTADGVAGPKTWTQLDIIANQ